MQVNKQTNNNKKERKKERMDEWMKLEIYSQISLTYFFFLFFVITKSDVI